MRIILAAIMLALVALPAQAQHMRGNRKPTEAQQQQNLEKKKKSREAERAYKDALDKIPNQKPADPWGNMR
jgi:hypothetical protein